MKNRNPSAPIHMELYFSPGFQTKPALHVGSQSMRLYHGDKQEQSIEMLHVAAAGEGDIVVVRNMDPSYAEYWKDLMGNVHIINIETENLEDYLSNVILSDEKIIQEIQQKMHPDSSMMVYFATELEDQLANKIGIKLHGTPGISQRFGTKTGIRILAQEEGLSMPEGFVCSDKKSVADGVHNLFEKYSQIIIKHDLSSAGRWMKKISKEDDIDLEEILNEICGGEFIEGRDFVVVEAWVENKASLCAHIEILEGREPIISAAWQQIIDEDGVTYIGAGPLFLSEEALDAFQIEVMKLANALKKHGAVGSFAPDFIITSDNQSQYKVDTPLLIELNARVPFTAFPLEIIKNVKGEIGTGFLSLSMHLPRKIDFKELKDILVANDLLITQRNTGKAGVVPFNIGQLAWQKINFAFMADDWEKVLEIKQKISEIFKN